MTGAPYYADPLVTLHQGDARQVLPTLPSESVGLVVTSPPYNARIAYESYADWLSWDEYWSGLLEPVLRECYRLLVPGGRACINFANMIRFPDRARPEIVADTMWSLLKRIGFLGREHLVWIKGKHADEMLQATDSTAWGSWCSAQNPVLRAIVEPIYIVSKEKFGREKGPSDLTPDEFKQWTRNAWTISSGHADQYLPHPAKFPPELPYRLIKLYSYTTDVILDPFVGLGTTCRVAKNLGRRAIGVELSPGYCRDAANRCRQDLLPLEAATTEGR